MIASRLKSYLDREGVRYLTVAHSPAFTAREIAEAAHVRAKEFAKTVVVHLDGRYAMAVMPASEKLDTHRLRDAIGAKHVRLALESELDRLFPGCEPGAMPPFGNLYGLEVFVSPSLAADERIAFNAGSHSEVMWMPYIEFAQLVKPVQVELAAKH
jgi:Ala-tRNA(Pro) deacylase